MLENLHLLHPQWLWALLPLGLLLLALRQGKSDAGNWRKVVDTHLLPHLLVDGGGTPRRWPLALLAGGWILAVTALANPVFEKQPTPLFRSQAARIIVLDLSRSMDTPDIKPSRMVRARFKVADILARSEDSQTGLVVFAGDAFVVTPLTDDNATIRALLGTLKPELMPVQGSRADLGLARAGELLQQAGRPRGDILLITDGADTRAVSEARRLHERGDRVSVLAVGSPAGAPLPDGNGGVVRDRDGTPVTPGVDRHLLRELAQAGGGGFAPLLDSDDDLDRLLEARAAPSRSDTLATGLSGERWKETGPWLALLLLPLGALAFRRGWLLGIVCVMAGNLYPGDPALAFTWHDLWQRPDQQAARALAAGDLPTAIHKARDPARLGTARFRSGEFSEALDAFQRETGADGDYNQGNALARLGRFEEAIAAYDRALARQPDMADALYNRRQIEKLLEQQKREEQHNPQPEQQEEEQENQQNAQQQQEGSSGRQKAEQQEQNGQQDARPQQQGRDRQQAGQTDGQAQAATDPAERRADEGRKRPQGEQSAAAPPTRDEDDRGTTPSSADASAEDAEQARQALAKAMEQHAEPRERTASPQAEPDSVSERDDGLDSEQRQAVEQWLRRIPDDPGGLLRRKFLYQYARRPREHNAGSSNPW